MMDLEVGRLRPRLVLEENDAVHPEPGDVRELHPGGRPREGEERRRGSPASPPEGTTAVRAKLREPTAGTAPSTVTRISSGDSTAPAGVEVALELERRDQPVLQARVGAFDHEREAVGRLPLAERLEQPAHREGREREDRSHREDRPDARRGGGTAQSRSEGHERERRRRGSPSRRGRSPPRMSFFFRPSAASRPMIVLKSIEIRAGPPWMRAHGALDVLPGAATPSTPSRRRGGYGDFAGRERVASCVGQLGSRARTEASRCRSGAVPDRGASRCRPGGLRSARARQSRRSDATALTAYRWKIGRYWYGICRMMHATAVEKASPGPTVFFHEPFSCCVFRRTSRDPLPVEVAPVVHAAVGRGEEHLGRVVVAVPEEVVASEFSRTTVKNSRFR